MFHSTSCIAQGVSAFIRWVLMCLVESQSPLTPDNGDVTVTGTHQSHWWVRGEKKPLEQ